MNNAPADPLSWYYDIPVVTRVYLTGAFMTTGGLSLAVGVATGGEGLEDNNMLRAFRDAAATLRALCQMDALTPAKLFYSWPLICKGQLWRLVTNFFYFGSLDIHFLFHMYFLVRYSRLLEEGEFRGRTGDFVWFLLFCASILTGLAPFVDITFLGRPLAFMMVYVWGRRNENVRMNMLGMFPFTAPYLAWVLMGFSFMIQSPLVSDLLGITVGHVFYFLEFVYPEVARIRGWRVKQLMRAPRAIQQLCGQIPYDRHDMPEVLPAPGNEVGGGRHLHAD